MEKVSFKLRSLLLKTILIIVHGKNVFVIKKEYDYVKKNLYKSINHNLKIQEKRLFNILIFAIKYIPYYKKVAKERNIQISKETVFKDIKKFPILTKDIIRENWDSLHIDLNKFNFKYSTSGGTTGEPIKIIHDFNFRLKGWSATNVFDEIGGYFRGDKLILLWGSERDIIENSIGLKNIIINLIFNHLFLNTFKMSDLIMDKYVKIINRKRSFVILAYIQSIHEIAKYIKRNNLKIKPIKSMITSAGDLNSELRAFLESIFKCKIFNRYGTREVGIVATSCEKSEKLHINMYQQYVEILDENENEVEEHEKGNIIITNLLNYGMPLIRYKIGDLGSLDFSQCSCGRGLIRFDNVYGRIIDIFKTSKGELVYGDYFTHLFYFRENVKMFQVIQEEIKKIKISIVTLDEKPLDQSVELDLIKNIKLIMGNDCSVEFNYVSSINPSISGKYIYTISKVN